MTGQRAGDVIRCDAVGCRETHPVEHEHKAEPGFQFGRWLGWLYLDLNRPDLSARPLRFCGVFCLRWWTDNSTVINRQVTDGHWYGEIPPPDQLSKKRGEPA